MDVSTSFFIQPQSKALASWFWSKGGAKVEQSKTIALLADKMKDKTGKYYQCESDSNHQIS